MRVHNYTHSYLNNDNNIEWFDNILRLSFNKDEYGEYIEKFRLHNLDIKLRKH